MRMTIKDLREMLEEIAMGIQTHGTTTEFSKQECQRLVQEIFDTYRRERGCGSVPLGSLPPETVLTQGAERCFQELRNYLNGKINVLGGW